MERDKKKKLFRLIRKRKREFMAAAAILLAAGTVALVFWALAGSRAAGKAAGEMETVQEIHGEPFEVSEPLEKNAHPEINELVSRYFTALAEGDEETLLALRDSTLPKELLRMQENSSHIENYSGITVYTRSGEEEESYVVFARYEVKFKGIDTTLPGILPLYVKKNAEGSWYLHDLYQDDAAAAFVGELAAEEEVKALYDQVTDEYEERLNQDAQLAEFMNGYMEEMKTAVGEALQEQSETQTQQTPQEQPEQQAGSGTAASGDVPDSGNFRVSETVNIRKSASENAERLAVCYEGEILEIVMRQADGWTRVKYNGQTGYVRSDVLK